MWKLRYSDKLESGWKSWIGCRRLGNFNIQLRLDLDIRALIIASRTNLESGPRFTESYLYFGFWSFCGTKYGFLRVISFTFVFLKNIHLCCHNCITVDKCWSFLKLEYLCLCFCQNFCVCVSPPFVFLSKLCCLRGRKSGKES